jgi:hypothetical protein
MHLKGNFQDPYRQICIDIVVLEELADKVFHCNHRAKIVGNQTCFIECTFVFDEAGFLGNLQGGNSC